MSLGSAALTCHRRQTLAPTALGAWVVGVLAAGVLALGALSGCRGTAPSFPGELLERRGDEISACGQLFHSGTRVVLWNDPGGYDAYRAHRHFQPNVTGPSEEPGQTSRFGSFRRGLPAGLAERVRASGWSLEDLRKVVTQVVLHYDQCGTSQRCFEVLHDIRGLSCHFLLDLDGTIYQTLDLKERAWHAAHANDRSIGIEIASIGCYPEAESDVLSRWYVDDGDGLRIRLPEELGDGGLPIDFVPRPARPERIGGVVHGRRYYQHDFTEEQYRALESLLITLCRVFPEILPAAPLDEDLQVFPTELPTDAMTSFRGIVGHHHLSLDKRDPGPAFNWKRVIETVERAVR